MVKIAIAGGSGNVASEIIDVLVATGKHEILVLSRKDAPAGKATNGVSWVKADYNDPKQLAQILQGVHTVLSFVITMDDPASIAQKNLIDAAIEVGVKRFAPSEWASAGLDHLGWYDYKATIREYLKELNKDKKVLEYSLFQPGIFTNYMTHPYDSTKHITPLEVPFDFNKRRALILEGGEDNHACFVTVQDLSNVVARAVEFEGEWPVIGGIRGTEMSVGQLIALGEKIRGGPFKVDKLKFEDLKAGVWKASWTPLINHPSAPPDQIEHFSKMVAAGLLLAIFAGAHLVSDEWNRLLPDYKFTDAEEFLTDAWKGKP
jgi:hypothetical protein